MDIFFPQLITFLLIGIIACFVCPGERTPESIEGRQGTEEQVRHDMVDLIGIQYHAAHHRSETLH